MGHRAGTLARPGPKVQGQGSSQRRGVKRKAGVSLVVEMGGRAFHMNGTTRSKIERRQQQLYVWRAANIRMPFIHLIHFIRIH